jgi:hypothetical protein
VLSVRQSSHRQSVRPAERIQQWLVHVWRGGHSSGHGAWNGPYRIITDVMDDEMLTDQLLDDAKAELSAFSRKYQTLKKLSQMTDVFTAIDQVVQPKKIVKQETRLSAGGSTTPAQIRSCGCCDLLS